MAGFPDTAAPSPHAWVAYVWRHETVGLWWWLDLLGVKLGCFMWFMCFTYLTCCYQSDKHTSDSHNVMLPSFRSQCWGLRVRLRSSHIRRGGELVARNHGVVLCSARHHIIHLGSLMFTVHWKGSFAMGTEVPGRRTMVTGHCCRDQMWIRLRFPSAAEFSESFISTTGGL